MIKYLVIVFFFISCSNERIKKHQILIERDSLGKIISKSIYYISDTGDSLLDGQTVYYYPNGNVEDSFNLIDGDKEGNYFQYYSNGKLKGTTFFVKGKANGFAYSYYPNTKLEIEEFYRSGNLIFTKNFHENGILKSYFIMKNNKESCYILIKDSTDNIIEERGDSSSCGNGSDLLLQK
jgi:antitoxin component YwqK of YwqJK toxin-antitoxin module